MASGEKRISDLEEGNYSNDKDKAYLPASVDKEQTFKYPLGAMEQAANAYTDKKIDKLCLLLRGQIGHCGHYTAGLITAELFLSGYNPAENQSDGRPPETVPFKVTRRTGDHWDSDYIYTPRDLDIWQNLYNGTFWIWVNGKWQQIFNKGTVDIVDDASIKMSGSTAIEMLHAAKMKMVDGSKIDMSGSGELNIKGGAKLNLQQGAAINLGNSAKLHAMGAGAISGLQGHIMNDESNLYANCRVYKIKDRYFSAAAETQEVADSFLLGDVFYFVADETLEGEAYINYKNIEGYDELEILTKDNSLTLMLIGKNEEGSTLFFKKMSDTANVPNIFKILNPDVHLSGNLGEYVVVDLQLVIENVNRHTFLKAGQTLIYDAVGNIGIVTSIGEDRPGGTMRVTTIATSGKGQENKFTGTQNQLILGNGVLTPLKNAEGQNLNAPASLFALQELRDLDPEWVYCERDGKAFKLRWQQIVTAVIHELVYHGIIAPPPVVEIETVSLSIDRPINGQELNTVATRDEEEPKYGVSSINWEPNDESIVNGTQEYAANMTIFPIGLFKFADTLTISINGVPPTAVSEETNGMVNIKLVFPPTMTALPIPELEITEPAYGATRETIAAQRDTGQANYSNSILWTPQGATFPAGISEGDFSLLAAPDYRWNTAKALLNNVEYAANPSEGGMRLNFIHSTASLSVPLLPNQFQDPRDGQIYSFERLPGGLYWMTENFKI